MTEREGTYAGGSTDLRMPGSIVTALILQLLLIVGWAAVAAGPLMLAWANFGGNSPFASHDIAYSVSLTLLALPAVVAGAVSVGVVIGLYCETGPGSASNVVQIFAVLFSVIGGFVVLLAGTGLALLLIPPLIANAVLFQLEPSRRWFDDLRPVDSPTRWELLVLTLTTLAVPFWTLGALPLLLEQITLLLLQALGDTARSSIALLVVPLLMLGAIVNVVVLLAVARRWRVPREVALVGSLLAGVGLVLLDPSLWWAATLALVPSALLWLPASTRGLRTHRIPDAASKGDPQ